MRVVDVDAMNRDAAAAARVDRCFAQLGLTERSVHKLALQERASKLRQLNGEPGGMRGCSGHCRPETARARSPAGASTPGVLTYGEVPAMEALRLVAKAEPRSGDVFYDLGSGRGQVVLAVHQVSDCMALANVHPWQLIVTL